MVVVTIAFSLGVLDFLPLELFPLNFCYIWCNKFIQVTVKVLWNHILINVGACQYPPIRCGTRRSFNPIIIYAVNQVASYQLSTFYRHLSADLQFSLRPYPVWWTRMRGGAIVDFS